jgi:UDP-glucuronate decarboxylase
MVNSFAESIDRAPFLFDHSTIREDIERVVSSDLPWSQLEGKTILISGAAGMLAAAMVDALMSARTGSRNIDLTVVALVRSAERAKLRFRHWLQNDGFSLVEHDVTQPLHPENRPQIIVHAASLASPKFYGTDPVGTMLPNVLGTLNLLNLARDARAERFLFFSSAEVYGQFGGEPPLAINEQTYGSLDPNDNRACYAESKRMGEALCSAYLLQYGVPVTMLRPFHTYGPGMKLDDGRVFADFVRDAVTRSEITVKGDGTEGRSFCYLSDATEAYLRVLLIGQPGHAYNVGNPSCFVSIRDLAALIAGLNPERRVDVSTSKRDQANSKKAGGMRPDISRISALGWSPKIGLADGFRRTIQYYSAVGGAGSFR